MQRNIKRRGKMKPIKTQIILCAVLIFALMPAASAVFNGSYDMLNQDDASWYGSSLSQSARTLDWADINNDGKADAIIGAWANNSDTGAVYILYGPQDQVTDVSIATEADVALYGEGTNLFGSCIGSGDVNGDGYDDLILGAAGYGPSGEGRFYIIYGGSSNIPSGNIGTVKNASINGTTGTSETLGIMCDTADVNGDGYDDILAASIATASKGKTYLIYGQSAPLPSDSVITSVYNESWIGGGNLDYAWIVRRAGDVNNDGYDDILIGAPYNGAADNGTVYLIYGQGAAFNRQNYTMPSGTGANFTGQTTVDYAGRSVSSAGDVNNDGYDDFLIAAPWYNSGGNNDAGIIYLFYGGSGTPWSGGYQVTSANATFTGISAGDFSGRAGAHDGNGWPIGGALSYGDFNQDGYSDFIIGVYGAHVGGRTDNGQVVLYYGRATLFSGNYLLNMTDANATFYGESNTDRLCALPTGMAEGVTQESILMGAINYDSSDEGKGYEMLGEYQTYSAINPNGTMRFTTDKYVSIQTMNPDINILNFRLGWQNFSGTFDTSAGTCSGCTFDLDNLTCQAEVEKIFGMFVTYNLTINLTPDRTLNFTALNLLCRDGNETVTAHPGCIGLFSAYPNGITSPGCMQWINSTYATTFTNGLAIDLHNLTTSIEFNMGTITPRVDCEMIACELNGTWEPGDTQEFTINKTITVTAN